MQKVVKYKLLSVYRIADIIEQAIASETELWNYSKEYFIKAATSFSKDSLLHQYIATTAFNHYRWLFRKTPDEVDPVELRKLFEVYEVQTTKKQQSVEWDAWFESNEGAFQSLFDAMAEEVFYLVFGNRRLLLNFNTLIIKTVQSVEFPAKHLTLKKRLKRKSPPKWVQLAIFHRDKGRCVFCNADLTCLINTLGVKNFDHIVPLDLYGTNDPSNIQLLCDNCNKKKSNKRGRTSDNYIPWWEF